MPSDVSPEIPDGCSITFAQILSRHGARDPTSFKSKAYHATIQKIRTNVKEFTGLYSFLADYQYTLGADQLTTFGEQQLVNSGNKFYNRYGNLTHDIVPFVRASGQHRVVESARFWNQGFKGAKMAGQNGPDGERKYPYINVIIPEDDGVNNTLSNELCDNFRTDKNKAIQYRAKAKWASIFATPIQIRLNNDLPGANLSVRETIYMMDICPFNVVASPQGQLSPFCALFTEIEWHQYNYYETLDKWYGDSFGNPLAPTQGVGFANELIARMTDRPVNDHTSTNHTLDGDPNTFPLRRQLYADFSHDNDMTTIFSALGLYNEASQFPNDIVVEPSDANGFSAGWLVPFAARAYFEKMVCRGEKEELVRVIINDRVLPLEQCGGDELGRCTLTAFTDSLSFVKTGGHWDQCFT